MTRIACRWLFPGDQPPLRNVCLEIDGTRVLRISPSPPDETANLAIIPGLINAHTHLEFSLLPAPLSPLQVFPEWIRSVIRHRREFPVDLPAALNSARHECLSGGVTALAEIATSDHSWNLLQQWPALSPHLLVFREILGLQTRQIDDQLQTAATFLTQAAPEKELDRGLSPHAPYSLHPDLFAGLCDLAREHHVPVAMHLAESPDELRLLKSGSGPLADLLQSLPVWQPGQPFAGTRPLDFLRTLSRLDRVLIIHGNLLTEQDWNFLADFPAMSVVYCPRTHAAMQHGTHPWRELLQRNVNVAIGTDSRASNPDLSIWKELQFLHQRHPDVAPTLLLQLVTVNAARALGWDDSGTLAAGKTADLCLVRLPQAGADDPLQLLEGEIVGVMRRGEWTRSPSA